MATFSFWQGIRLANKGIYNYITNRPLVVSFEVTLSCNCNCHHCDLGGVRKDEEQIQPDEYTRLTNLLNPLVVQISGGEPLLRKDIRDVIQAIRQCGEAPYLILVTNGSLLNESNYLQLHEAGVNQFAISLDFPDERHDEFRRHSGLFKHLEETIPRLARFGYHDIILNSAITRANLRDIMVLAQKAKDWNVSISYTAYTALRTQNKDYCINTDEELELLRQTIDKLLELKKRTNYIANSKGVLLNTLKFFEQGYMQNCQAGKRFLVVMPDGKFVPCSMHRNKYSSQKEMIEKFTCNNTCNSCYVAIRSYSEQSLLRQLNNLPAYGKLLLGK